MKDLIIIGARGFGREVYNLAIACNSDNNFNIKGFLDDKSDALDDFNDYPPIISSVEDYTPKENDVFVCALGDVSYKKKYTDLILHRSGRFISLIHPSATIYTNAHIGDRVIIANNVTVSCDTVLGHDVVIHSGTVIGHDVKIGNNCSLGANTFYGGYAVLEDFVTVHPQSSVMPHKIVRKNCIVGISSVIVRNTQENTTLHGNPATVLFTNNQ